MKPQNCFHIDKNQKCFLSQINCYDFYKILWLENLSNEEN